MKQRTKEILAVILVLVVIFELLIYKSEFNFAYSNIYTIASLNLIVCIGFIFWYSKKLGVRILTSLVTIGIGFLILFSEFVRDFSQTEKRHNSWEINNYEIIYENQEYFAGPGSEAYLKLREKFVLGLFYEDIDEIDNNSTFLRLGITDCIVKFVKTKTEFDLCKKEQLK